MSKAFIIVAVITGLFLGIVVSINYWFEFSTPFDFTSEESTDPALKEKDTIEKYCWVKLGAEAPDIHAKGTIGVSSEATKEEVTKMLIDHFEIIKNKFPSVYDTLKREKILNHLSAKKLTIQEFNMYKNDSLKTQMVLINGNNKHILYQIAYK